MTQSSQQGAIYSDLIVEALTRHGSRPAFVSDGAVMTYDAAAALTSQMVQLLSSRGVKRGSGVGALAPNAPELWLS